ncbi:MFS general substrate transporter [Meredithblackwellia eburnea MCA 4105]
MRVGKVQASVQVAFWCNEPSSTALDLGLNCCDLLVVRSQTKNHSQTSFLMASPSHVDVDSSDSVPPLSTSPHTSIKCASPAVPESKFSPHQKLAILSINSFAAVLGPFASNSFLPCIPDMEKDLKTSATVLNVNVAVFFLVIALVPLLWARLAAFYGRRPILIVSLPLFTIGSCAVAVSTDIGSLYGTRVIQAIGASAALSIGAGALGDIYVKTERARALSTFYGCVLLSPALSPCIAGLMTEYTALRWRALQWLQCGLGAAASALAFTLPETALRRGIDSILEVEIVSKLEDPSTNHSSKRWTRLLPTWTSLNPLAPLALLAHPNILFVVSDVTHFLLSAIVKILMSYVLSQTINSSFVLMTSFGILVPLTKTIAPRYNLTNLALIGCLYLAAGSGNLIGSRFAGRLADSILKKRIAKGIFKPEDRLRATMVAAGGLIPMSALGLGWLMEKGHGPAGLAGVCILLFINGLGVIFVLAPSNTYCVDVLQHRSTEVMAANNCIRYLFSAASSAFVLPMIASPSPIQTFLPITYELTISFVSQEAIGVGWTNTFTALCCWIGFALTVLTIARGSQLRNWKESTGTTNLGLKAEELEA